MWTDIKRKYGGGGDDIITQRKSSQFVISPNLVTDISQGREGGTCSVRRKETCQINPNVNSQLERELGRSRSVCACMRARLHVCMYVCVCVRVILHNIHTQILLYTRLFFAFLLQRPLPIYTTS